MTAEFSVGLVQMESAIGDKPANLRKAQGLVEEAIARGARIVCLPELFATGYFCHTSHVDQGCFQLAETTQGETVSTFAAIARRAGVCIIVPFFEQADRGVYYNSAAMIDSSGQVQGVYRKVHVPWSLTGWEKFYMRPGSDFPVFPTPLGKIGILICYDRDFPEAARSLAVKGADMIFLPTGAPKAITGIWRILCQARAYENQLFVFGTAVTGRTDAEHHEFTGNSIAVDPFGSILGELGREEGIMTVTVSLGSLDQARTTRFIHRDRRPESYSALSMR